MSASNHPEHSQMNSLTAPRDFVKSETVQGTVESVKLDDEQVNNAMKALNVRDVLSNFPRVEKYYADPPISGQLLCLHSFVPAKGATPDADGVYGMVKCRGTFSTEKEADERAEFLVRNVDSYHSIYHSFVGRPFPLSRNSRWVGEVNEIDLKKKVSESIDKDVQDKRAEERKAMREIQEREKLLRQDVSQEIDPYDRYTELQVKRAQMSWTYVETIKKLDEYKRIIAKAREDISAMDAENPSYRDQYVDKYMKAREETGLKADDDSFLAYLTKDPEGLGF
jgi:hypothetical protein